MKKKEKEYKNTGFNKKAAIFSFFPPDYTVAVGVTPTHARLLTELEEYTSDCDFLTKTPKERFDTFYKLKLVFAICLEFGYNKTL